MLLDRVKAGQERVWRAMSRKIILDASHDDGRAKPLHATLKIGRREPAYGIHAIVENAAVVVREVVTDVGNSKILLPRLRMYP